MRGGTFLPIVVDDNLVVTDTLNFPSSIRVGDALLSVNSVALRSVEQYHRLVQKSGPDTTLRLRVKRKKDEYQFEVVTQERPVNRLALPLRDLTGQVVSPEKWTGTTVVYVWSVNCGICLRLAPQMAKLAAEHPEIRFVAISPDPPQIQRQSSTPEVLRDWPLFTDDLRQLSALLVFEYPTFLVLDDTQLSNTFRGRADLAKLRRLLGELTTESAVDEDR